MYRGNKPIFSKCPKCGESLPVRHSWAELAKRLRTCEAIEWFCVKCEETWALSEEERAAVAEGLKRLEGQSRG